MRPHGICALGAAAFSCMLITCNHDAPPPTPHTIECAAPPQIHYGEATYYTFADGGGNCCFDPTPNDLMVGAMNHTDYAASNICGACVELTGPKATITIRIVDQCPECAPGDIDLSPQAFERIADLTAGRVPISWNLIPCVVIGPIVYHFKDGSNQWWTAVQIRNHRFPIFSVEYLTEGGAFAEIPRLDYNYFVAAQGLGTGPYTFRVTDLFGHALVDSGIIPAENGDLSGAQQFPDCE